MVTKKDIKNEIDQLSETELTKVYWYLMSLNKNYSSRKTLPSMKLKGKLDHKNIREIANE